MPVEITPKKLNNAVQQGFKRVEKLRTNRIKFIAEYVGPFYDTNQSEGAATPLNFIYDAIAILVPNLVSRNPKHSVKADFSVYGDYAKLLEISLDKLAEEQNLYKSIRMVIIDALFGFGIMRTGLTFAGQTIDYDEATIQVVRPYADRVDLDDFCVDPFCRNFEEAAFIGNRVLHTRQFLYDSGEFDPEVIKKLPSAGEDSRREVMGISMGQNRKAEANELMDYVELVEVYIPDEKAIVTVPFCEDTYTQDFMRVVDYTGPDPGPYHFLGFHWVPNNPFPVPPVAMWYDLHTVANRLAAQATSQSLRQRDVLLYRPGAHETAERVHKSRDGDTIAADDPQGVNAVSLGGVNEKIYEHLTFLYQRFAESGPGDFRQLGGMATQAETATQATILKQAASVRVNDMNDQIYAFTAEVAKHNAWYLHHSPVIEMPVVHRDTNGAEIQMMLTPEARRGEFIDYHFKIQPMSMKRTDPQEDSLKMMQFIQTFFPIAIQAAQAFGPLFNPIKFITNAAEQWDLKLEGIWLDPEYMRIQMTLMQAYPQMLPQQADQAMPTKFYPSQRSTLQGGTRPGQYGTPDTGRQQAQQTSAPAQRGDGNMIGMPNTSTVGLF